MSRLIAQQLDSSGRRRGDADEHGSEGEQRRDRGPQRRCRPKPGSRSWDRDLAKARHAAAITRSRSSVRTSSQASRCSGRDRIEATTRRARSVARQRSPAAASGRGGQAGRRDAAAPSRSAARADQEGRCPTSDHGVPPSTNKTTTTGTSTAALITQRIGGRLRFAWLAAEAAGATGVFGQRGVELGGIEVRPEAIGEVELGVCRLPDQEVADALLAAGANEQVEFRQVGRVEARADVLLVDLGRPTGRRRQRAAAASTISESAGVVEGDVQGQALAAGWRRSVEDRWLASGRRQLFEPAQDRGRERPDGSGQASRGGLPPPSARTASRPHRSSRLQFSRLNAKIDRASIPRSPACSTIGPDRVHAGGMTLALADAVHPRPAAVAVHDDRHVARQRRRRTRGRASARHRLAAAAAIVDLDEVIRPRGSPVPCACRRARPRRSSGRSPSGAAPSRAAPRRCRCRRRAQPS